MKFDKDETWEKREKLLERVLGDNAEIVPWWDKQPVNCFQMELDKLDEVIANNNPKAIERAFEFAEQELRMWVRFYGYAKKYTADQKAAGKEVHWRVEA